MGLGGVRVPQGPVASGMGQAAWLHPQSFNLGCAPGDAGAIPGVTARSPSPVCALSNAAEQRCRDGAGGGITPCSPPFQEPALLPSLPGSAVSGRVGAGAGNGAGDSSRKRELESIGLITAGNRSPEPSELLIPLGSFHRWLCSRAVPAALAWEGAEPIPASMCRWGHPSPVQTLCGPQIPSAWQGHQYPRDANSTHNPPPPGWFSPAIRDHHHHQRPVDGQPRISPARL